MLAAAGEVRLGRTVSLAAPVENRVTADNPEPAQHQMTASARRGRRPACAFATDRIAMNIHGNADSHLDALCHVIFDGGLYNGVPADAVTAHGAAELSIAVAADGIVGRGVLLDMPAVPWRALAGARRARHRGRPAAAERDQGVRVGRGDIAARPGGSPQAAE